MPCVRTLGSEPSHWLVGVPMRQYRRRACEYPLSSELPSYAPLYIVRSISGCVESCPVVHFADFCEKSYRVRQLISSVSPFWSIDSRSTVFSLILNHRVIMMWYTWFIGLYYVTVSAIRDSTPISSIHQSSCTWFPGWPFNFLPLSSSVPL